VGSGHDHTPSRGTESGENVAALEARLMQARAVRAELEACLQEIRTLQRKRIRLETLLRDMHREAVARREQLVA
jgi:hypothetical protein